MNKQRRFRSLCAALLCCLALAACGQTGPLVLPSDDKPAPADQPQN